MEKLQEAAERHLIDAGLKNNNNIESYEVNEQVKIAFVAGGIYTMAHSKEVIEELVKALEEARSALSLAQSKLDSEVIDRACVTVRKAIDKSRKNVNP